MRVIKVYAKEDLREKRVKMGYTLTDLAERSGYTTSAFGKIERRKNGINPRRATKVLKALEVSFDDIFELIGD